MNHNMGWLVTFIGDSGSHLLSLPPVVRLIIMVVGLLVLGAIPATHSLALWAGTALLLLSIFYGV